MRLDKIIESVKKSAIAKYIKTDYWVSGSVTDVPPITVWITDSNPHIEIQLVSKAKEHYFRKAIEKIKTEHSNLIREMFFCKNDGSCPDTIRIYLIKNNQ